MASAPIHLKFKLMARNIMTLCGLWLLLSSSPSSPSLSTSSSLMSHSYSLPYLSPLSLLISYVTPSLNLNIIRIASAQQTNNSTTNSTTTSNSTSVDPALCNNGDSVGQLAFVSPGNKAIVATFNRLNITWKVSDTTTTIPKTVTIYYALISSGSKNDGAVTRQTFYSNTPVVSNYPFDTDGSSYLWTVPQLQTGSYQLLIVGDNYDPQRQEQLKPGSSCILGGLALPATTFFPFKIVEGGTLQPFPDLYGPSSWAVSGHSLSTLNKVLITGLVALLVAFL
jgi:hypothetical protein